MAPALSPTAFLVAFPCSFWAINETISSRVLSVLGSPKRSARISGSAIDKIGLNWLAASHDLKEYQQTDKMAASNKKQEEVKSPGGKVTLLQLLWVEFDLETVDLNLLVNVMNSSSLILRVQKCS